MAVPGAGNAGLALAGDLALKGLKVPPHRERSRENWSRPFRGPVPQGSELTSTTPYRSAPSVSSRSTAQRKDPKRVPIP
jgi:hypothetical protein